ncbi:MAG: Ig-like domain-containing protein [Gemmatimonadales bacterium]|nr:Ig-like domain-containing protein [Gemmatimonadales bacterium]
MNKFYRSMLFSGALAAGLAACGDDVTVIDPPPPPPPPPAVVRSVTVAPDGISVNPGQTVQMTAAVSADAGVTATVTWQVSEAGRATISAAGLLTVLANATSGPVVVRATATGGGASVQGQATLTVVGTSVTAVTVTPPTATLNAGTTVSPPQSTQAVASVTGTNNPAQTVTWTSLDPTIATVNADGVITANNTAKPGNVVIRACSTVDTSKCGTLALVVVVPDPASVQIQSVTATVGGIPNVPVVLTNVFGQIEIALNVEPGARQITRVDALIGGRVVATQNFTSAAPLVLAEAAPTVVVLSTNTQQARKAGGSTGALVPVIFNGNSEITANLYVSGSSTPIASNAVPVVMNNPDLLVRRSYAETERPASLAPTAGNPSAVSLIDGNTYYKGTQDVDGFDYLAFGTVAPASVSLSGNLCGGSSNLVDAGATAAGGIALTGTFACAGVEGGNTINGVSGVAYPAGAVGPDGTALVAAAGISTTATAFTLAGEQRWNVVPPTVGPNPGPVWVDNKGPTVAIDQVAFNDSFDQPWINAAYAFAQDLLADDGTLIGGDSVGVGIDYSVWPRAREFNGTCGATNLDPQTGDVFPETTVSDGSIPTPNGGRRICTYAEDLLGNAGTSGASNYFGVDKVAPSIRFLGSTAATPPTAGTPAAVGDSAANTTIYSIANPTPAEFFGVEALDGRSGFHQGAPLSNYPASYVLNRFRGGTPQTVNATFAAGAFGLPTLLSDTYVRGLELPIQGTAAPASGLGGVGYYFWSGKVTDRAGNESTTLSANFASDDLLPPNITGLGFASAFYTPGTMAPFGFSANDDLEIIDATLAVTMAIPSGAGTALRYPYGSLTPLGVRWDDQITNVINGVNSSIPYFLFRVDEACSAAATPYAACVDPATIGVTPPVPYITTSILGDVANGTSVLADTTQYGLGATKLPTAVSANVNDVAGQSAAAPISAPMLATQFNPQAGLTTTTWATADLLAWSASVVTTNVVAVHVASTSIVVPFFDHASLWRLYGTEWVRCGQFPAPALTDNGAHRFWTYTTPVPTTGACAEAGGGVWRVMGTKSGAGLFTPSF